MLSVWAVALPELQRAGLTDACRMLLDACAALLVMTVDRCDRTAAASRRNDYDELFQEDEAEEQQQQGGACVLGGGQVVSGVLELVEGWAKGGATAADPSLVRFFVFQVRGVLAAVAQAGSVCVRVCKHVLGQGRLGRAQWAALPPAVRMTHQHCLTGSLVLLPRRTNTRQALSPDPPSSSSPP